MPCDSLAENAENAKTTQSIFQTIDEPDCPILETIFRKVHEISEAHSCQPQAGQHLLALCVIEPLHALDLDDDPRVHAKVQPEPLIESHAPVDNTHGRLSLDRQPPMPKLVGERNLLHGSSKPGPSSR